jgi:hypothetical protein
MEIPDCYKLRSRISFPDVIKSCTILALCSALMFSEQGVVVYLAIRDLSLIMRCCPYRGRPTYRYRLIIGVMRIDSNPTPQCHSFLQIYNFYIHVYHYQTPLSLMKKGTNLDRISPVMFRKLGGKCNRPNLDSNPGFQNLQSRALLTERARLNPADRYTPPSLIVLDLRPWPRFLFLWQDFHLQVRGWSSAPNYI